MNSVDIAWLVLRVCYAALFLYPLPGLIRDWQGTVSASRLLNEKFATNLAAISVLLMFFGALSILFGVYGQVGALGLLGFNLGGSVLHQRLAGVALQSQLSSTASDQDKQVLMDMVNLAVAGHSSSAWKNYVLAAVACFFMILGTGPYSLYP